MFLGLAKLNTLYIKVIFFLICWHRWKWKYLLFQAHKKSAKNIMCIFYCVVRLGQQKKILIVEAWYYARKTLDSDPDSAFLAFISEEWPLGRWMSWASSSERLSQSQTWRNPRVGHTHTHTCICSWELFFSSLSLTHTCTCFVLCELALSYDFRWKALDVFSLSSVQRVCCHGDK